MKRAAVLQLLRRWLLACGLLACGLLALACSAHADVFRPAYLELREAGPDRYEVLWKVPTLGASRLPVQVAFPPGTKQLGAPRLEIREDAQVERWQVERAGGLNGQTLRIDGIAAGVTDVIVRVERQDGTSQVERLLPARPEFVVKGASGTGEVARAYLVLGIGHILSGTDHLLFLLALLLIVRGGKRIFATVTAFTAAHSITLASATMGWVHVPGPPVEATIALSIVFVAAEVVHGLRGRPGLTARAPWVVAFCFGLLHGFGFAGALAEVGLPQKAIPVALLAFNLGVEAGQLVFVAAVLGAAALAARWRIRRPAWSAYLLPYAIGGVGMFWVIDRIGAFS